MPVPEVLVSSVLANFICDACKGDSVLDPANREISEHVEALNAYSLANPGVSVAIAPPLPRSVPDWYQSYFPVFSTYLFHEVSRLSNPRVKYLAPFVAPPSYFESDGVHLNPEAGSSFIQYLVSGADTLFPPSQPLPSLSGAPEDHSTTEVTVLQLSRDVKELRSEFNRRRCQDNLVFARIKEDKDFEFNKTREDRCTISGLSVVNAPPQDPQERKEFFKNLISELVSEALPDADVPPQVVDVIVNMRLGRGPPFFEVKFDSVASSLNFRVAASKLAKAGTGSFKGVFVSNTVNLSTRVRIDILKLIAKRLTTTTEFAYVQGFSSRPTLHYLMRAADPVALPAPVPPATGTGRSYTFAESVERWGDLLPRQSLEPVRRKAAQAFSGCLEQYFVVLKDRVTEPEPDIFSRLLAPGPSRPVPPPRGGRRGGRLFHRSRAPLTGSNADPPTSSSAAAVPVRPSSTRVGPPVSAPAPVNIPSAAATLPRDLKRGLSPESVVSEPSKKK